MSEEQVSKMASVERKDCEGNKKEILVRTSLGSIRGFFGIRFSEKVNLFTHCSLH